MKSLTYRCTRLTCAYINELIDRSFRSTKHCTPENIISFCRSIGIGETKQKPERLGKRKLVRLISEKKKKEKILGTVFVYSEPFTKPRDSEIWFHGLA